MQPQPVSPDTTAVAHPGQQHQQQTAMHSQPQQAQHRPQQPLRRAVYVHVSDLTSAYNIDHAKLEEELTRVKKEQQEKAKRQQQLLSEAAGASASGNKDGSGGGAASASSSSASSSAAAASAGRMPSGVPTELDTSGSQRRLQPPRAGYNLCV